MALITIADEELVVSPKSLLPIGPSPIASSVDEKALENLGPRERALLALASKRPAPKSRAEQEQQSPWSIRGVSQVARVKAAKIAARRRVTIGEWVKHAIQVYAGHESGIAPAPMPEDQKTDKKSGVSDKTLRIVKTLARHFEATGASDKPETTIPDTFQGVEGIEQIVASELASDKTPEKAPDMAPEKTPDMAPDGTPDRAPDGTPDVPPATIPAPPVIDGDHTEQKFSELTEQLLGVERRSEQRLASLTKVLTNLANRLNLTGDPVLDNGREGRGGLREDAAKLSRAEMVFWESIKDGDDPDAYESYLECFPNGLFASLARRRAARPPKEDPDKPLASPAAPSRTIRRHPPPAQSLPKFDYDTLNEQAIKNTKRRN